MRVRALLLALTGVALLAAAAPALAQDATGFGTSPFSPATAVPVSQLARPFGALDPTRLHVSTSLSFGSGFGGTTQGLQVTSLSYQFGRPLAMSVSVGSTFGGANANTNAFFLEGLNLSYRPMSSMVFNIQYHDFRSPLQYSQYDQGPFGPRGWGY